MMTQSQTTSPAARRWYQFGFRSLLFLVTFLAVMIASFLWRRSCNSDNLTQKINALGTKEIEATTNLSGNEGLMARVFGNEAPNPTKLRVFRVRNSLAKLLQQSNATADVAQLDLVQYEKGHASFDGWNSNFGGFVDPDKKPWRLPDGVPFAAESAPMFFRHWPKLTRIVVRDVALPRDWIDQFKFLGSVEEVIVSGGACNLEPEALIGMKSLQTITLCERGITASRREALQRAMPTVRIRVEGSFDSPFPFDGSESLSAHDPVAYERMKKLLAAIDRELVKTESSARPPQTPATLQQIAEMERKLGIPLPKSLRAFYEVTNGWPEMPFMPMDGMRSIEDTVADYHERTSYRRDPDQYEFSFGRFSDWSDPAVIPITPEDGIWFDRDVICNLDPGGESGPWAHEFDFDLFRYFEAALEQLKSGKLEGDVWVELKEY